MTQIEWVLNKLLTGKSITPIDALNGCGCFRLAAIIFDLRTNGWNIETVKENVKGKKYARYVMQKPKRL